MSQKDVSEDIADIRQIIDRQFRSLEWGVGEQADWATFKGDFLSKANLYPSARPVNPQSVDSFVARMKGLARTSLPTFRERMLGAEVQVFGNVAVALAACELTENEEKTSRGVEALLLVKDDGAWRIAAQAWDMEGGDRSVPEHLLR